MNYDFEYVDVQWTLITGSSTRELIHSMKCRVKDRGWQLETLKVDEEEEDVPPKTKKTYPDMMASMIYVKGEQETDRHSIFASAWNNEKYTLLIGGLYPGHHCQTGESLFTACDRAFIDLVALFGDSEALLLALTLEDDGDLGYAPGMVACYRPELWKQVAPENTQDLVIDDSNDDWVVVRPSIPNDTIKAWALPEETRSAILAIESNFKNVSWPGRKENP